MSDYNPEWEDFFSEESMDETEETIEFLVSQGAAEWSGVDEFGERMYRFNMEVLKEIMPQLYESILEDVDSVMLGLYEKGLVELEYNEDLQATFKISQEGKKILEAYGFDYFYDDEN